jgi:hypothetical protein
VIINCCKDVKVFVTKIKKKYFGVNIVKIVE